MFVGKARSLPTSGASERCFIHLGSSLTSKRDSRLERLAMDKQSSLLRKLVNYGLKSFMTLAPEGHAGVEVRLVVVGVNQGRLFELENDQNELLGTNGGIRLSMNYSVCYKANRYE
jgi:hypothetical protein